MAAYQNAKLTREVAEIANVEYKEGIFVQDLEDVEGDIRVAGAELALAEGRSSKLSQGRSNPTNSIAGHQAGRAGYLLGPGFRSRRPRARQKYVLVKYTKRSEGDQGSWNAAVKKARGDERSKQAIFELERQKQNRIERRIASCMVVAPIDGRPIHFRRSTINVGEEVPGQSADSAVPKSIPGSPRLSPRTRPCQRGPPSNGIISSKRSTRRFTDGLILDLRRSVSGDPRGHVGAHHSQGDGAAPKVWPSNRQAAWLSLKFLGGLDPS